MVDETRHRGGAEAVVDVHDGHAVGALLAYPERRGDAAKLAP